MFLSIPKLCFFRAITNLGDQMQQKMEGMHSLITKQGNDIQLLKERLERFEESSNEKFSKFLEKTKTRIEVPKIVQVSL